MFEGNSAAIDGESEGFRALARAIAHAQIGDAARHQRPNSAFACFTRAKDEDFAIPKVTENFLRKIDRDRANRDSAARNLGARPDLFGHSKRALKQSMQISAGSAGCARSFVSAFGLPKNLGFADHHGIEP